MDKLYIYGIATLLIIGTLGGLVWKWNDMAETIVVLEADKETLTTTVKDQSNVIDALTRDKEAVAKLLNNRDTQLAQKSQQLTTLKKKIKSLEDKDAKEWLNATIPATVLDSLRK